MEETNAKNGATTTTSSGQGGGSSNNQTGKPPAVATGGGSLSSPLPPEPSPITPLPQEDGAASKSKGTWMLIVKLIKLCVPAVILASVCVHVWYTNTKFP